VLGQPRKLWIRAGAGEDLGIACSHHAPPLAVQRPGNDCGTAATGARADDLVNEFDKVIWKSNGNLLAHPKMVAKR